MPKLSAQGITMNKARKLALASIATLMISNFAIASVSAGSSPAQAHTPPDSGLSAFWRNAVVYFLMTDRFANADPSNDQSVGRKKDADLLRGFEGGDIKGVTAKIRSGYFSNLGVDAIWTTPLIDNVRSHVGENEWGKTYAYHGYWPLDWTTVDPNFGSVADLQEMIKAAHAKGIRVLTDVIINHAGAPTAIDPKWPGSWVRSGPACDYKNFKMSVHCELSFTLQDILTESEQAVELPDFLLEKWRAEGRLDTELAELDAFFSRTKLPRAPKYYIVKWLTDWVRDYGIDGFRVDTAKHTDPEVWLVLKREAEIAQLEWRSRHPERILPDQPFYMVGEVFNYGVAGFSNAAETGLAYEYGDRSVNFYDYGFDALINMGFATHAKQSSAALFGQYDQELRGRFAGKGVLNYISSHDDMGPFDPDRKNRFDSATKLMLAPGGVQIYYGDEIARSLVIANTKGDATLRSNFDWQAAQSKSGAAILQHWQKLGQFRHRHLAVGAGDHQVIRNKPLVFSRRLRQGDQIDQVVIALGLKPGMVKIPVGKAFADGESLRDAYSGQTAIVKNQTIRLSTQSDLVLLERL
jgi:alpha-amylase